MARALGVSPKVTVAKAAVGINPAAETPVEGSDGPKTQRLDEFNDRLGGYLGDGGGGDGRMKPDPANWGPLDWARRGLFLHKGGGASMEEGRNRCVGRGWRVEERRLGLRSTAFQVSNYFFDWRYFGVFCYFVLFVLLLPR